MEALRRYVQTTHARVAKAIGVKTQRQAPKTYGGQHVSGLSHSQIMTLPETRLQPIQDINPASATFGQFFYMAGFDGLGEAPLG